MSEAVLMVGTPRPVRGPLGRGEIGLDLGLSRVPHAGDLLGRHRRPTRHAAPAGRRHQSALGTTGVPLRRRCQHVDGDVRRRDPVPRGHRAALERVWQLRPAPADQPGVVYAGTEPSAIFRSDDGGRTFEFVQALWDHPQRPPGLRRRRPGHPHHRPAPRRPPALTVAISSGGIYQTHDDGQTWKASPRHHRRLLPDEPRIRPVHAQGHPRRRRDPSSPRATAASTARRRRPPWTSSPTACRPTSASPWSPTRIVLARSTCSRSWPTSNASRRLASRPSGARTTRGDLARDGPRSAGRGAHRGAA